MGPPLDPDLQPYSRRILQDRPTLTSLIDQHEPWTCVVLVKEHCFVKVIKNKIVILKKGQLNYFYRKM